MLQLRKLVLQGFKSFKRKRAIPIPDGFSVFTGPNGSGKTNIADAISFVLGRISSQSLRAQKLKDLIFHGSGKKDPSDYARVVMYLDNSSGDLPFDEDEVTISRRVNQKGVSTYRLNGKVVTRQQILGALAQAHLHPQGHNIIQQGDVNQIVEMSPEERRKIIDQISGIAEYDDKKQKAEQELGKTEEKLKEAEIVLKEKNQVLSRLKKEKEAAMEYQQLQEDLDKIEESITHKQHSNASEELEKVTKELEEKENRLKKLEHKIEELDDKLSEEEDHLEDLAQDVMRTSDEMETEKQITRLESEKERLEDKIESNKREVLRLEAMMERLSSMDSTPAVKAVQDFDGVHGTVLHLIDIPSKYETAVRVSAGKQLQDLVTDTSSTAVRCIKHLKKKKIGRAKFLPLDKIRPSKKKALPPKAIGWLSDLIQYDDKYSQAIEYLFGKTACVEDIDTAKKIAQKNRLRMVTLDGDLVSASGAMTGGFYKKKKKASKERKKYQKEKEQLEEENKSFRNRLEEIAKEIDVLSKKVKKKKKTNIQVEKAKIDKSLKKLRNKRKEAYEERLKLQQKTGKLNIKKAKLEANVENLEGQLKKRKEKELEPFIKFDVPKLKDRKKEVMSQMQSLGSVNLKALDDFETIKTEYEDFKEKVDRIIEERDSILETVEEIDEKRTKTFMDILKEVDQNFQEVYSELTGGEARLELEEENNIDSGLLIKANPGKKKLLHLDSMSGGEKTLTAFAFLFAIQRHKPAPFYILDEADATLDKKNSKQVAKLLKKYSDSAQFISISHNDAIIKEAKHVYGVSMDQGESKIFSIKLPDN